MSKSDCYLRRSVNVPARLLDSLDLHRLEHEAEALLIHLSTDQVYDGSKPCWKETDRCKPVNVYGSTKREAELLIQVPLTNNKAFCSRLLLKPSVELSCTTHSSGASRKLVFSS